MVVVWYGNYCFVVRAAQSCLFPFQVFDSIANFGSKSSIDTARETVLGHIDADLKVYKALNESRNPLAGLETCVCVIVGIVSHSHLCSLTCLIVVVLFSYIIPASVGVVSYVLRWFTDMTCSATVCKTSSQFLSHTYAVVWCFLLIIALTKFQLIKASAGRMIKALEILMDSPKVNDKRKAD